MKEKTLTIITGINSVLLLFLVVFLLFFHFGGKDHLRVVYVDNLKLYNDFNMTRDLNQQNSAEIRSQKKKLDSLYTLYQIFSTGKKHEKAEEITLQIRTEDQKLKDMGEFLSNDVSQKVWKRLNGYIKEYGEQHTYKIIMGTQGNGNVMYANAQTDITEEVLQFANHKYEGLP